MRIAHVVSTYPPYRGGQGNVAKEIAERTATRGHEVVVVTPQRVDGGWWMVDGGRATHSEPSTINFQLSTARLWARFGNAAWCPSIARTLEDLQPDVVHLHWPFIGGVAPVLVWCQRAHSQDDLSQFRTKLRKEVSNQNYSPIRTNRRIVVQYHMDLIADGWRGALFAAYQRRVLPQLVRTADRVIVSSFDYAQHGALAPFVDALGDRLVEIPLGVDIERFTAIAHPPAPPLPEGGGERKEGTSGHGVLERNNFSPSRREGELEGVGISRLTTHDSRLAILFVGGLDRAHAFKGLPVLLEAIKRCQTPPKTVSDTVFLRIVGDGDRRPAYEAQARELGISDRVEFLGSVSDATLPAVYRSADVLVLPSTARSEAFGVVLLEAMASGLPVIASDLPGVRTVVADDETGLLVPPGDAAALAWHIEQLARNPKLTRRMGAAGRRRVEERYDWDRIIDAWERCDQSLWTPLSARI